MTVEGSSERHNGAGCRGALLRAILRAALPLLARVEVTGREHLGEGGRLLVCNHVGWADPIWIAYSVHPRMLHQMAKHELFHRRWGARLLMALGAFPVDRARPSATTLKYAADLLRTGSLLLIFPAGTRDRSQTQARRGAALIAAMARAPIVPVHYQGPATLRLIHLFMRPRIVVRFGPSIDAGSGAHDRRSTARLTADLDRAMNDLAFDGRQPPPARDPD